MPDIVAKMEKYEHDYENHPEVARSMKNALLRQYLNPRTIFPTQLRPPPKLVSPERFEAFSDLPFNRLIVATEDGLLQVYLMNNAIAKPQGTLPPF